VLYDNEVYIPTFWVEVSTGTDTRFEIERGLAGKLLPLPVDHRYNEVDMQRMAAVIQLTQ
jgi:hypothetical protein